MQTLKESLLNSKRNHSLLYLEEFFSYLINAPTYIWDITLNSHNPDTFSILYQNGKQSLLPADEIQRILFPHASDPSQLVTTLREFISQQDKLFSRLNQLYIQNLKPKDYQFARSLTFYITEPVNTHNLSAVRRDFYRIYANNPKGSTPSSPPSISFYQSCSLPVYAQAIWNYASVYAQQPQSAEVSCMDTCYAPSLLPQPGVRLAALIDENNGSVYSRSLLIHNYYVSVYSARRNPVIFPKDPLQNKLSKILKAHLARYGYTKINASINDFNLLIPKADLAFPVGNNIFISLPACPYIDNPAEPASYTTIYLYPIGGYNPYAYRISTYLNLDEYPEYSSSYNYLQNTVSGFAVPYYLSKQGIRKTQALLSTIIRQANINVNSSSRYVIPLETFTSFGQVYDCIYSISDSKHFLIDPLSAQEWSFLPREEAYVRDLDIFPEKEARNLPLSSQYEQDFLIR